MTKNKKIECLVHRSLGGYFCDIESLGFDDIDTTDEHEWVTPNFCIMLFRILCPALVKGLRKGRSRKCILTQTSKGIKLERADL